jgi:hypothetical protein
MIYNYNPQYDKALCDKCGLPTIIKCQKCSKGIQGAYLIEKLSASPMRVQECSISKNRNECTENTKDTLTGRAKKQMVRTNNPGDFEFEGLGERILP